MKLESFDETPQVALVDPGDAHRVRMAKRSREIHRKAADIGEIPAVVDPDRREACRLDLPLFLQIYFPNSTGLSPFGDDHIEFITRTQNILTGGSGGKFANVFYRGAGKSSAAENTVIWSTVYAHKRYFPLFAATGPLAKDSIASIQNDLIDNDLLMEDFPEVCHAFRLLAGNHQGAHSQSHNEELTHIRWLSGSVVFPAIRLGKDEAAAKHIPIDDQGYTLCSEAKIETRGILAALLGMKYKRHCDGVNQRPDAILIDDPQTPMSAEQPLQTAKRLKVINASIGNLGGHRSSLAIICNGTVMNNGCVMHSLLDPEKSPGWEGRVIPMVKRWADAHETLWREYERIFMSYDKEKVGDRQRAWKKAHELYVANRQVMDAGCEVSWQSCFNPKVEVSAVQHAYNYLFDKGEEVFSTEAQGKPVEKKLLLTESPPLTESQVMNKVSGIPRSLVPVWATHLTAFFDVHQEIIFWVRMALVDGFTGVFTDYGTWPDQKRSHFLQRDPPVPISSVIKTGGVEARIIAALQACTEEVLGTPLEHEGGGEMSVSRALVDAGKWTKEIYEFCRRSKFKAILMPSHGKYVGARNKPLHEYDPKPGMIIIPNVIVSPPSTAGRHVNYDANAWKTFLMNRLRAAIGDSGCLSLYGDKPIEHKLFAQHLTAEVPIQTAGNGRTLEEWVHPPNKPDNHWLDGATGACVAGALIGLKVHVGQTTAKKSKKKRKPKTRRGGAYTMGAE